jgi:hypothetical protein
MQGELLVDSFCAKRELDSLNAQWLNTPINDLNRGDWALNAEIMRPKFHRDRDHFYRSAERDPIEEDLVRGPLIALIGDVESP